MAHYRSNWSDPSHYCHPALPCATKPLNVVLLVQTFHLNSRHHLSTPRRNTAWYLLQNSQIKGDGRVLTSGTISGGSYGVSATRQLATTKPLRHNNISEPRKLNCSVGFQRERALSVFPWLEWAVRAVTSTGRGAAVSQPTFHLFWQQQELTTTSNWATKTFQSFSHNVLSKAQFPSHFSLFGNSPKGCNWSSLSQWQQQPSNEPVGVIPISSDLKTVWD